MRSEPYRVAFIGTAGPQILSHLAALTPAIQPYLGSSFRALSDKGPTVFPELVALLPGTREPLPEQVPFLELSEADLGLSTGQLETKLLAIRKIPVRPESRLLGSSPAMTRFRGSLAAMARTGLPILLTGENGTGKDLAAQEAHSQSSRNGKPFVPVNCGSIPAGLAESEFFGCVRGAFTGAENREGFCQQADGGTLFLDEIGELAPDVQAKLLRVLDNQEVRKVGSPKVEKADFRLICATNRDLPLEVKSGRFREDLFYRINVLALRTPALRDRKEDLPLLANFFLSQEALGTLSRPALGKQALLKLADYHWPGNLRQLRNTLLRAAVLHPVPELEPDHLQWEA